MNPSAGEIKQKHPLETYLPQRGVELKKAGTQLVGICPNPSCNDKSGHLYVDVGKQVFHCKKCGFKGDLFDYLRAVDGLDFRAAISKLNGNGSNGHKKAYEFSELEEVTAYSYQDASGAVTRVKVRYLQPDGNKTFLWFGPNREKLPEGSPHLLYRLPEVIKAQEVWVVEGEKDADNLRTYGLCATTADAGANAKWRPEYNHWLTGKNVVLCGDNDEVGLKHVNELKHALADVAATVRTVTLPERVKDVSDFLKTVPDSERDQALSKLKSAAPEAVHGIDLNRLDRHAFDFHNPPEKPLSVIRLAGQSICTAGNLVTVQGQVKSGKSALLSAMIAGSIAEDSPFIDLLGLECIPSQGKAIIHFDTEQSAWDYDQLIRGALRRAEIEGEPPPCLETYWVVTEPIADRFPMLCACMERAARRRGGIHIVLIDGIADLFPDVNQDMASIETVDKLQNLAAQYDCPIVCVIHENPGSDFGKTRGHLGSQLSRKSQSNLKIAKDNASEIITLYTDSSRNAHIPRAHGIKFKWDSKEGMHTAIAADNVRLQLSEEERMELKDELKEIFRGHEAGLVFMDLNRKIREMRGIGYEGARTRQKKYESCGLLSKDDRGRYYPNHDWCWTGVWTGVTPIDERSHSVMSGWCSPPIYYVYIHPFKHQ